MENAVIIVGLRDILKSWGNEKCLKRLPKYSKNNPIFGCSLDTFLLAFW